jgi:rubredoxin
MVVVVRDSEGMRCSGCGWGYRGCRRLDGKKERGDLAG